MKKISKIKFEALKKCREIFKIQDYIIGSGKAAGICDTLHLLLDTEDYTDSIKERYPEMMQEIESLKRKRNKNSYLWDPCSKRGDAARVRFLDKWIKKYEAEQPNLK